MVFSSTVFLFYFFPLFFVLYFLCPAKAKNPLILFFSILFYSWGGPLFIFVILGTTLLDFFLVKFMDRGEKYRWVFLAISLTVNLGLLFYFKYLLFFIENTNALLSLNGSAAIHLYKIILPLGLSFYTFESITYIVDVYRKQHKPLNNFWDYQLYIIFFPKLLAGPIVRYGQIEAQIRDRQSSETIDNRLAGMLRFIIGLSKKVLIANTLGETADFIFDKIPLQDQTSLLLWIGSFAYTFQIYFDFAGYSDMALGLARMMGFHLPENFNFPYISGSITEFWRRWHITLGVWMKNYIYIPLGGNRGSKQKGYLNLCLVFLISGFWHGAAWNFIFWGIYHGFFLVIERFFLLKYLQKIPKLVSALYILLLINIGWVFFRANSFTEAKRIFYKMFSFNFQVESQFFPGKKFFVLLIIAFILSMSGLIGKWYRLTQDDQLFYSSRTSRTITLSISCLILLFISASFIVSGNFNPFIYWRF